jgi:hypothetical protein
MMDPLSRRVQEVEARCGVRIVLRAVHVPEQSFRGRLERRGGRVIIEYRDDTPGFFWHQDIIGELLDRLERGEDNVTLCDDDPETGRFPAGAQEPQ